GFPVGIAVPTGYYDAAKGAWIPSQSGRIVKILAVNGGKAVLDVDGKGEPANLRALADLRVSDEELAQLGKLYPAGTSLWRVPIPHFSVWDCNWGFSPPKDAKNPDGDPPQDDGSKDDPDGDCGSFIETQNQMLREALTLTGTPFRLHYHSGRVPGAQTTRTIRIPLSGKEIPKGLKHIELEVFVA